MADFFLVAAAADLAVGKPCLEHLPDTATVAEAIRALQLHPDGGQISVWQCSRARNSKDSLECACVGVVSKADILCHLAKDESLQNPERALQTRVSELLPRSMPSVRHVEPKARLLDALAMMADGAHHLVIPINSRASRKDRRSMLCAGKQGQGQGCANSGNGHCWLSQEDVVRYIFGCMGVFNPVPMMRVDELGIINTDFLKIDAKASARAALDLMKAGEQVAVVEEVVVKNVARGHRLVGELSSFSMWDSDESVAFGLATLSVKDFLSFARNSSQDLLDLVRGCNADKADSLPKVMERLKLSKSSLHKPSASPRSAPGAWEDFSSEEEDEGDSGASSPDGPFHSSFGSKPRLSPRLAKEWSCTRGRCAPITCRPWSSLAAVMAQALANRVTHIWVTDADDMLIGVITFREIIELLLTELTSLE